MLFLGRKWKKFRDFCFFYENSFFKNLVIKLYFKVYFLEKSFEVFCVSVKEGMRLEKLFKFERNRFMIWESLKKKSVFS